MTPGRSLCEIRGLFDHAGGNTNGFRRILSGASHPRARSNDRRSRPPRRCSADGDAGRAIHGLDERKSGAPLTVVETHALAPNRNDSSANATRALPPRPRGPPTAARTPPITRSRRTRSAWASYVAEHRATPLESRS